MTRAICAKECARRPNRAQNKKARLARRVGAWYNFVKGIRQTGAAGGGLSRRICTKEGGERMTIYEFIMICFTFIDLLLKVTDRMKTRKKK